MSDVPKSGLELQIEQEAAELANVPKIPIHRFMGSNAWGRCHICGQIFHNESLNVYDAQTRQPRLACKGCHPNRGKHA